MARLGRSFPIRPLTTRQLYRRDADINLPTFALGWEFPTLTVTSPSVSIPLPSFALGWEFPSLSLPVGLPTFALGWEFPQLTVFVPVNPGDDLDGPGQLSLNGFKMGGGTPYRLDELVGVDFDMPPIDNGNVNNPSSDGAQSGRKLAQPRIITVSFKVRAPADQMRETMEAFRDNTPLADSDEELDLAIQVVDRIYVTRGAVTRRSAPINKQYRIGLAKAVLQIECSDPRLYSRDLGSAQITDGGTVEVTNAGNRKTRPLIRIPGPAHTPRLQVFRTLADGSEDLRVIQFNTTIADGDTLTVDIAHGTAELAGGTSVTRYLTGSVALPSWVLGRGVSSIAYATADGTAPDVVVLWRHAWL
ncbi:hypothetical protein AB0F17_18220 [Nonomuraea sp. NPDC026600]|uniref:hypothetical protein n=1 Tax=Nonomuraea sp. NPDC026600 TaxID=3155363 RepID=UPI0034016742